MAVTTNGLKAYLNLDHNEDNSLIASLLMEAKAWIAGYTDAPFPEEDTPAALDGAARQLVAHWYENRGEDAGAEIPLAVRSLCAPYIVWAV